MMPYSPCDGDLLCQNATLHRALWSEIRKQPWAYLMHLELFVLGGQRNVCTQSGDQLPRTAYADTKRRNPMSVAKIIELSAESPKSFEDAIQNGISRASKTIHGIKSAWVKEQHVMIDNGKVSLYRIDLKVTFVLD